MFSLDALFCDVDDFCTSFESQWRTKLLQHRGMKRVRAKSLCLSEIMTILIAFHQNHSRNFKHFYLEQVKKYWHSAFPGLPSYQRFVEWMPSTNDQLKNISQIEHSRHRSPVNFCVNVLCGLIAYCHQPKKPTLRLDWLLPPSA
jgi:hypothetical protein